MRRYAQAAALLALCLVAITASCRRTQPSLIDRNQAPDTQLWYAPPDSSDYEYIVHLYWRGVDADGTARRFIWVVRDSIGSAGTSWNPALRLRDYREGRITSRTDSVFAFRAYKDVAGIGVRKNRQAFFVAAIDDNGVIDPLPAAVEFVATIGKLPEIHFTSHIDGAPRPYQNRTPPADTVGMYTPFAISYHGSTVNGRIRGYLYFPLSTAIVIPGSGVWSYDATDTLRSFANTAANPLPAGVFRFAAKCIDDASAESQIDGARYRFGVSQVVVNFDPDTWLTAVKYTSSKNPVPQSINFTDNLPDTVPYRAWVWFRYYSRDDRRDVKRCSITDRDSCLDYNVTYFRESKRNNFFETSGALPRAGVHDSDCNTTADSNTVNIGSYEYEWKISAVDENGTKDGTPATFHVIGNYNPSIDTASLENYDGDFANLAVVDTLHWNFYKGIGWPYTARQDTFDDARGKYYKRFALTIHATGHDDARDPAPAVVKSWDYSIYTDYSGAGNTGTLHRIGRSGVGFFPSGADNRVDDRVEVIIRYDDPQGDDVLGDPLYAYLNEVVTVVLRGRDTRVATEPSFGQYVFWNQVKEGQSCEPASSKNLINDLSAETSGRWTPGKVMAFYLKLDR